MKKVIALVFVFVMSVALYADERTDIFNAFYEGVREAEDADFSTQKDLQHWTIFVNIKVNDTYADAIDVLSSATMKKNLMSPVREDSDLVQTMKETNFTVIYNFITKDYKVYSIAIHSSEY